MNENSEVEAARDECLAEVTINQYLTGHNSNGLTNHERVLLQGKEELDALRKMAKAENAARAVLSRLCEEAAPCISDADSVVSTKSSASSTSSTSFWSCFCCCVSKKDFERDHLQQRAQTGYGSIQ